MIGAKLRILAERNLRSSQASRAIAVAERIARLQHDSVASTITFESRVTTINAAGSDCGWNDPGHARIHDGVVLDLGTTAQNGGDRISEDRKESLNESRFKRDKTIPAPPVAVYSRRSRNVC